MKEQNDSGTDPGSALAVASYFGPLCFAPLLAKEEDEFVRFHMKQGIALLIVEAIVWAVFWFLFQVSGWCSLPEFVTALISFLQSLAYLCIGFLIYTGVNDALDNRERELPFIGELAKRVPIV